MSKKKLEFDPEATESIREKFGTNAFVFRNENGSRVILSRLGEDHWSHLVGGYNPWGSPPDQNEEDDNPEDDDEDKKKKRKKRPSQKKKKKATNKNCGGWDHKKPSKEESQSPNPDNTHPGDNTVDDDYYKHLQEQIDKMEETGQDVNPPPHQENQKNKDEPLDNLNRKEKNIYEEMRDELDKQMRNFYKTGKFTINPEKMMNEVFSKIMEKYGYKTYAGKWFKKAVDGVNYVKSCINKIKSETISKIKEKISGKITNKTMRKLLGLDGNKWWRISTKWDLGKIFKMIRSNPLQFILKAFTSGTQMGDTFEALIEAVGATGASDVFSYIVTLLVF